MTMDYVLPSIAFAFACLLPSFRFLFVSFSKSGPQKVGPLLLLPPLLYESLWGRQLTLVATPFTAQRLHDFEFC